VFPVEFHHSSDIYIQLPTAVNESVLERIFIGLLSWGKSIVVVKGVHHLRGVHY